jgi:hypothetical protein
MRIPVIQGVIDRRILVNYRVDLDVLAATLPKPFRPMAVGDYGIAGICLIRLKHIRPRFIPSFMSIGSENAAHRIAVEWDDDGERKTGVYIPRRDTSSKLNGILGGRMFPGVHHQARFVVKESDDRYVITIDSLDDSVHMHVDGASAVFWRDDSVFESVDAASRFFEIGSLGYSPSRTDGEYEGLELRSHNWKVEPMAVTRVESSFFEDGQQFPQGSVEFDCALLMRGIDHEWHGRKSICCPAEREVVS